MYLLIYLVILFGFHFFSNRKSTQVITKFPFLLVIIALQSALFNHNIHYHINTSYA